MDWELWFRSSAPRFTKRLCTFLSIQMLNLNTTQIGLIFLVPALLYALVTPLMGWIGDKTVRKYSLKS